MTEEVPHARGGGGGGGGWSPDAVWHLPFVPAGMQPSPETSGFRVGIGAEQPSTKPILPCLPLCCPCDLANVSVNVGGCVYGAPGWVLGRKTE